MSGVRNRSSSRSKASSPDGRHLAPARSSSASRAIRSAKCFSYVSRTYFPSNGEIPDELLFIKPQYNTWIELIYDQREDRIRKYAGGHSGQRLSGRAC